MNVFRARPSKLAHYSTQLSGSDRFRPKTFLLNYNTSTATAALAEDQSRKTPHPFLGRNFIAEMVRAGVKKSTTKQIGATCSWIGVSYRDHEIATFRPRLASYSEPSRLESVMSDQTIYQGYQHRQAVHSAS